jgi:hypothetical protein
VLDAGITGNVFITGQDVDYHVYYGDASAATLFTQAMAFVSSGSGTGLFAMSDIGAFYSWMPASWGISAADVLGEDISSFTAAGLASGVYAGLTPADLSSWGTSYHNIVGWGDGFAAFQLANNDTEVVAVGRGAGVVPAPSALLSLLTGLTCLGGWLRRKG